MTSEIATSSESKLPAPQCQPTCRGKNRSDLPEAQSESKGGNSPCFALRCIAALDWVTTEGELGNWVTEYLSPELGTRMILLSAGSPGSTQTWRESARYCHQFPLSIWQRLCPPTSAEQSPIIGAWLAERNPLLIGQPSRDPYQAELLSAHIARSNINALLVHGMVAPSGHHGILVLAINPSVKPGHVAIRHLDLVLPKLHRIVSALPCLVGDTLSATSDLAMDGTWNTLTAAEKQVLKWLGSGKSNWAIAQILGRSENTVKNQVASIFAKLEVTSRAQASQWLQSRRPF